ncbi:ArgE/DapE family deacylase [Bacillus sp. DTU_2020_1000418_1_SI_GHA_SEK_038]|uniref:ArgE/DapE family deacylase n=1 Tax=Bacillus sp. DTU_2020_1000418_1_SI_GHA_SEK_038 TaxID=3077585 RepID=UPI0028E92B5B|nr:ArgE/DapE family deacylase [Bacillus sp. DTU_2020_1000418_1_SI_GHA_SEK_038]WNS76249.1 ArgE/DapE family deacylase [Bacillus sp. DTU_2020_1000418_1_SI_GHA_SEK_038]
MLYTDLRNKLIEQVDQKEDLLIDLCSKLVRIPSESPISDTRQIAQMAVGFLEMIDGAEVTIHTLEEPIVNVVAKIKGNGPGKRLIFNGHLDTYPVGDQSAWTVDPFSALVKDGRLYGRGSSDMKGGIASYMLAFMLLAECRNDWSGEVVLTLAGDEETMGVKGTKYLLDTVPEATGDAMICGDVGSPTVLRFGEKGLLWLELNAAGKPGHGAHVHKGVNAIDRLIEGMTKINETLRKLPVNNVEKVTKAILEASEVSEEISGKGETEVLQTVTVNFGMIEGGISANLIPDKASAKADIRLPVGTTIAQIEQKIKEIVDPIEGLSYNIVRQYEPNWSDVDHEIFTLTAQNVHQIIGESPVITMRVGASDARLYRIHKKVPTVVCGLTPYNLGGPDEYIELSELVDVAKIHTLTAFDYLSK